MIIIDSHTHIFEKISGVFNKLPLISLGYGKVKNGNGVFQLLPPSFKDGNSTVETLTNYMDWCDVSKAILVPNVFYGYHNEYSNEAIKRYPKKFKAIALINILKGKASINELHSLVNKGFSGLKIDTNTSLQFKPELMITDKILEPIFDYCNKLHLIIMFDLYKVEDLDHLNKISENFNKIKYIICHFGSKSVFGDPLKINDRFDFLLNIVSNRSNMWLETSGIHNNYSKEDYPFYSSCKLIEKAHKTLGPNKIIWGSDYPANLKSATYKQLINYIIKGCKKIPKNHLEMILFKNALSLFWP